jgi:hypothetical protein
MKRLPLGIKQKAFTAMGYTPSPAQLAIHDSENRFDFVSGGWRSGKSFVMSRELVPHCLVPMPKPYTILLIGPTYKEPRVEFEYMVGCLSQIGVLSRQNYNGEIRIVDEVYKQLMTTDDVIEICKEKPWWPNVMSGVIDRAAKQHQAAESVLEMWHDRANLWLDLTEGTIKVADLTEQLRIHAKTGHLKVNPNCRGLLGEWDLASFPDGLEHLSPWRYKEGVEGTNISDRSVTGSDHASTALGYYLVHRFGYVGQDALDYGFEEYEPVAQEYGATESKWVAV